MAPRKTTMPKGWALLKFSGDNALAWYEFSEIYYRKGNATKFDKGLPNLTMLTKGTQVAAPWLTTPEAEPRDAIIDGAQFVKPDEMMVYAGDEPVDAVEQSKKADRKQLQPSQERLHPRSVLAISRRLKQPKGSSIGLSLRL
eukprot:Colp12_sorted_trinity150504_noHs@25302